MRERRRLRRRRTSKSCRDKKRGRAGRARRRANARDNKESNRKQTGGKKERRLPAVALLSHPQLILTLLDGNNGRICFHSCVCKLLYLPPSRTNSNRDAPISLFYRTSRARALAWWALVFSGRHLPLRN